MSFRLALKKRHKGTNGQLPIAHFADMAAILNSIVLNIYYGMLRGQLNMYLPPVHPIIEI